MSTGTLYVPAMPSIATAEKLIPVIGYARVSTWREEKVSDKIQMDAIQEAAARRGRYVAEWIVDLDATGRNFKRKIMRGIELVEAADNPLREIWVWKFSRFGRNRHGVAINLARIESVGGELLSATEDVDSSTAVGEFTRDMLFAVAAFESNRAGEQWRETHELRRSLGVPATGRKRFGYRWHPRRLPDGEGGWIIQDEWYELLAHQAEVIHESYERYIAGKIGFLKIANRWNECGFVNMWGHPWQDQSAKSYLDSGFAAGLLRSHRIDIRCGKPHKAWCRDPEHWTYRPAEHDAIVDGDEWDAYRARRFVRKSTPRRSLEPAYPLSGLMRCGVCRVNGYNAYAENCSSHSVSARAYRCGPASRGRVKHESVRILRSIVEDRVHEWLLDVRAEIDAIVSGRIVVPLPRENPETESKRSALKAEISKLSAALDRATEGNVMGRIPDDTYERTRDKLTGDRDKKQRELDALPEPGKEPAGPMPHREVIESLIKEWNTISVKSKRVMLATLIRRVELHPDKVTQIVPVWAPPDPPLKDYKASAKPSKPKTKIATEVA